MAIATATTRIRVTEDTSVFPPSPILQLFTAALDAFAEFVARERDLAGVDAWDPAFRGWLADAEAAQDRLSDLQRALLAAPLEQPADQPLKLAAYLLQATLGADRPEEVAHLHRVAREKTSFFRLEPSSAVNRRVNRMLVRGLRLYEDFLTLDLVGHGDEDAELSAAL